MFTMKLGYEVNVSKTRSSVWVNLETVVPQESTSQEVVNVGVGWSAEYEIHS